MLDEVELSELLAVKLCHDLAGPVGAINNGIELIKDGGDDIYEQAVDLAEESAKNAVNRVLFYRQAYGTISSESIANISSLEENSVNFFKNAKTEVKWDKEIYSKNLNGDIAKLILNLMLIVSSAIIHGGSIFVGSKKDSITVRGEGKEVKIAPEIAMMLEGEFDDKCKIDVKNVQAYYILRLAEKMKVKLNLLIKNDYIEITIIY